MTSKCLISNNGLTGPRNYTCTEQRSGNETAMRTTTIGSVGEYSSNHSVLPWWQSIQPASRSEQLPGEFPFDRVTIDSSELAKVLSSRFHRFACRERAVVI